MEATRGEYCSSDVRNGHLIDKFLLNAGQKNCRMLHGEHSAILLTFIKLPFVINPLVPDVSYMLHSSFLVP